MRPLHLKIKGLRSYHANREIDFRPESLLAIIGDTGAGKSSVLEAISFALYGSSTWDRRGGRDLVSDRTGAMTVQLEFRAGGEEWRVRRMMSKGSRAAEHELVCLSDPERPRADGAREVNLQIEKLVGLNHEQFCSAVILPQGRFEQLLHATAAQRVAVLKGLLGLDRADDLRERASELEKMLGARLLEIVERRGCFVVDPHTTQRTAESEIALIEPQTEGLDAAQQELISCEKLAGEQEDNAKALQQQAAALGPRISGDAAKLGAFLKREQELRPLLDQSKTERLCFSEELATIDERLAQSIRDQRDLASVQRAGDLLEEAIEQLTMLLEEQVALVEKRVATDSQREELLKEENRLAEAGPTLELKHAAVLEVEAKLAQREADQGKLSEAIASLSTSIAANETAAARLRESERECADSEDLMDSRQRLLDEARETRELAQAELDRLRRLTPVAALAHACNPGEPCPVCGLELGEDFRAPDVEGLPAAEAAHLTAVKVETEAGRSCAQASASRDQLLQVQEQLKREVTTYAEQRQSYEATLRPLLGNDESADSALMLQSASAREVTGAAQLQQAQQETETKQKAYAELERQRVELAAHLQGERQLLEQADANNELEEKRVATVRERIQRRLKKLNPPLTLPEPPEVGPLVDRLRVVELARSDAQELERKRSELAGKLEQTEQTLKDTELQLAQEVGEPASQARETLLGLGQEVARSSKQVLPEPPPRAATVATVAAWGELVEAAASGELAALGEGAAAAVKAAAEHREAAAEQLRNLEIQSSSELEERRMTLHSELARHRRALPQVRAELGAITTLDELRSRTERLQAAFSELHHLLRDSNFVHYAVENRQHALLASASLVLGEVTGGRFGFSADFRIVDNETGQARATRTLSGGETFLASLALALGLVEVTARSGGRLDALFLDEGFGSLDPNALQQALGALERRAQSGRLVALISHVPLVAEQIERVLQVSKDHEGSQVRFLTAQERAEFAFADVARAAL